MISQQWSVDVPVATPPTFLRLDEDKAQTRADLLMTWGHAVALGGSLAGIAGGFALVAHGMLSSLIDALLFTAPVAGMALSSLFYVASWYTRSRAKD